MTPLGRVVRELIAAEGPMTVERYMGLALGHPVHGYYTTRDPLGAAGDFTTAPEISQMFGELIGLWAAEVWALMGRPACLRLIELGPGRGTLMSDALRAGRVLPGFLDALDIHLVETSPALSTAQRATLSGAPVPIAWHRSVTDVPDGPAIVIANEFFDALPIRQFVREAGGWHERLVGLGPDDALLFGLAPEPEPALARRAGDPGDIVEIGESGLAVAAEIGHRLASEGGAALLVDYGHLRGGSGDTVQAVRAHAFADVLAESGEADLTAHVDFEGLGRALSRGGAAVHGPAMQGTFLRELGIEARAARLRAGAGEARATEIDAALARLVGPDAMGRLFKVLGATDASLAALPGLAPAGIRAARDLEAAC